MTVYVSWISSHGPVGVADGDAVTQTERLGEGDEDAGDEVGEGRLGGQAEDERDDGRGGEDAPGDGPYLRDDEQSGHHPDPDDDRDDAPAQNSVASMKIRALREPAGDSPVGKPREHERGNDDHACDNGPLDPLRVHAGVFSRRAAASCPRTRPRARASGRPSPPAELASRGAPCRRARGGGREVDEPAVEVLHLHARARGSPRRARRARRRPRPPALAARRRAPDRGCRRFPPPARGRLPSRAPRCGSSAAALHQPLDAGARADESLVRLLRREQAHSSIVPSRVAPVALASRPRSSSPPSCWPPAGSGRSRSGNWPSPTRSPSRAPGSRPTLLARAPGAHRRARPGLGQAAPGPGRRADGSWACPRASGGAEGPRVVEPHRPGRRGRDRGACSPTSSSLRLPSTRSTSPGRSARAEPRSTSSRPRPWRTSSRRRYDLGFLVGEPVRARRLAHADPEGGERPSRSSVAGEPLDTAFVDTGFFITIPDRSLLGDLIGRAHGESIAGAAPGPDPFPLDRLRELDPDVYLATTESRVTLGSFAQTRAPLS